MLGFIGKYIGFDILSDFISYIFSFGVSGSVLLESIFDFIM